MNNKYSRYIEIIAVRIFGLEISLKLGNPMWFIQEFKNIKKGNDNNER